MRHVITKLTISHLTCPLKLFSGIRRCSSKIEGTWETPHNDLLVFTPNNMRAKTKIASFDLDGTLISSRSGDALGLHDDDWVIHTATARDVLKKLQKDDYKLVIFTNQNVLGNRPERIPGFQRKMEAVLEALDVPLQIFAATRMGVYRKPMTGMWQLLVKDKNEGLSVDLDKSFYCGDSAGRFTTSWFGIVDIRKDHSAHDLLFAMNLNIAFHTPEELFLDKPQGDYAKPKWHPAALQNGTLNFVVDTQQEIIVMVGCPGSGKTLFCKNYLHKYNHLSMDEFLNWYGSMKKLEVAVKAKQSIVIDDRNESLKSRQPYVQFAKLHNIPCRCFVMDVDRYLAEHNIRFRLVTEANATTVTNYQMATYFRRFIEPSVGEGFEEVVKVPWIGRFENSELEKLHKMYLLDNY